MNYLASVEAASPTDVSEYRVAMRLDTNLVRSKDAGAVPVRYTDDPNAPMMNIREEDVLKGYPLSYRKLTKALKSRYTDFIENQTYHDIRKTLESDKKYCKVRSLYPDRPQTSVKTKYYSSEVYKEFDKHYHKR